MLIDEATITVRSGSGGNGKVGFFPNKKGPNGGDGGRGGDVYIKGNSNKSDLRRFAGKKSYKAEAGGNGGTNNKDGANGSDLYLEVPIGTHVIVDDEIKFDVIDDKKSHLIARGGTGGKGNVAFATSTHQTPKYAESGRETQIKSVQLILKLIADIGLIGLPNAGKSSLLNELTAANVKTATYPFTTLEPNLGAFNGLILADIPGLIEGASQGKGLGFKFLKHIEKVGVLLHCISAESENVLRDFDTINKEMSEFDQSLREKKQTILLTKTDLIDEKRQKRLQKQLESTGYKVLLVSIYDLDKMKKLQKYISSR